MNIILASQSERRKELLDLMGLKYKVIVSNAEEKLEENLNIKEQSKKLAYIKAKTVFDRTSGDRLIIGSDTMVIKGKEIFGKPKDNKEAICMLTKLQGSKHQVITSICVLIQRGNEYIEYLDYDMADVYFKEISKKEIENWVNQNKVTDKAGAYAIQSKFSVHVEKIDGNYTTVVGLPIHKLYDILKRENEI